METQIVTRIFDTDNPDVVANKIFNEFFLGQSCTIKGFIMVIDKKKLLPRIDCVLFHLKELDRKADKDKRGTRNPKDYRKKKNTIGGYLCKKIFKYELCIRDGMPAGNIFRIK